MQQMAGTNDRVLVIGLDGATYDVLMPWVQSGKVPNLAHFMSRAALAPLESTRPYITPVAWTTFLTGVDPSDHGIWDYRYLNHRQRRILLTNSRRIRSRTLPQIVSPDGDIVSLCLPMTYPAPDGTRGIVVGGIDSPSAEACLSHNRPFMQALSAAGVRLNPKTIWKRKPESLAELEKGVQETCQEFTDLSKAALIADRLTQWKMMIVQFQTLDSLQHRCWHLLGVSPGAGGPQEWGERIERAITALDQALGRLLELADQRGAAVVCLSDHGFGPFRGKICIPELLRRRGLLTTPSAFAGFGNFVVRRAWKFRKGSVRMLGRRTSHLAEPLSAILPVDWRRSRALTFHGSLGGLVYINTPRRFGNGPVQTESQYAQTTADCRAAFLEARHPDTDEPLFEEVFSPAQAMGEDPVDAEIPDLVAIPSPGFHTGNKFDMSGKLFRPDPAMVATHRLEGVLMVQSSRSSPEHHRPAHLRDVAPTILAMLGLDIPPEMKGRVLSHLTNSRGRPVESGFPDPVGERIPAVRLPSMTCLASSASPTADLQVESRLRDLGYID